MTPLGRQSVNPLVCTRHTVARTVSTILRAIERGYHDDPYQNTVEHINSGSPDPAVRTPMRAKREGKPVGLHGTQHRPLKGCWRVQLASTVKSDDLGGTLEGFWLADIVSDSRT